MRGDVRKDNVLDSTSRLSLSCALSISSNFTHHLFVFTKVLS